MALYGRVSKREVGQQETENQMVQLRRFAEGQGWEVVREYVDRASGKNGDREEFEGMFGGAGKGEFEVVLFWSLDRFSREGVLATLKYLDRLTSVGVAWRSYTEQYLDSCGVFRDAVLAILAVVAKQERVRISERTLAGLETARRAGRVGGRPRRIFSREEVKRLRGEGKSLAQIAEAVGISKTSAARAVRV